MTDDPWADATLVAALFALDPEGFGGVRLKAPPGAARDRWLDLLRRLLPPEAPWRRLPPQIADDRLLGGVDLALSLATGRAVAARGLLAEADGGVVIAAMAERLPAATAARLAAALDQGAVTLAREGLSDTWPTRVGIVALDEGESEERTPSALAERLAFHLTLPLAPGPDNPDPDIAAARLHYAAVPAPDPEIVEALCAAGLALGVSPAAEIAALKAARAAAALEGRATITLADAEVAARLVLGPRATRMPAAETPDTDDAAPPPTDRAEAPDAEGSTGGGAGDLVLEAALAALPPEVLAALAAGGAVRRAAPGGGAKTRGRSRGRPAGVRAGGLTPGARLSLIDTLRAAAPWQRVRQAEAGRIAVRPQDFRIRRFVAEAQSTTILAVDASGSAALARLAEAKGAVELLLGQAYVARRFAALIAFRGADAEVLLPPTRALARARRRLAELPGGGSTPLAAGLAAALRLALTERGKGRKPFVAVLTDGRANISLAGAPGRGSATEDALQIARQFRAHGIDAALIDTAARPRAEGATLAAAMGALYAPLPLAHAEAMAATIARAQD